MFSAVQTLSEWGRDRRQMNLPGFYSLSNGKPLIRHGGAVPLTNLIFSQDTPLTLILGYPALIRRLSIYALLPHNPWTRRLKK